MLFLVCAWWSTFPGDPHSLSLSQRHCGSSQEMSRSFPNTNPCCRKSQIKIKIRNSCGAANSKQRPVVAPERPEPFSLWESSQCKGHRQVLIFLSISTRESHEVPEQQGQHRPHSSPDAKSCADPTWAAFPGLPTQPTHTHLQAHRHLIQCPTLSCS